MKKVFHFQPLKKSTKAWPCDQTWQFGELVTGIGFRQNPSIWNEVLLGFPGNIRWKNMVPNQSLFMDPLDTLVDESNNPKIAWKKTFQSIP